MMNADRARKYHYPCLAQAIGWGIAGDASHITAPARDGEGLNRAIGIALRNSGLRAEDIGAIHAHGTGTIYNDEMELTAFKKALDDLPIPIHSVKGAIGHTLGAAGGIEIAISIKSLSEQVIPPTVGLGKVMKAGIGRIRPEPVPLSGNCILKTNSGFGGINSAIILRKGER
jgi:3-oxoacyl-[acyl-carrier-protein] synthase II